MTQTDLPQPIPLPPDFPVAWERPEDAHRFWERETMHMPGQSTMLDDSFARRWCDAGFNAGCEDYSMPVRNAYRRVNTYAYQSIAPISHDPAELEQLGQEAQERLGAAIGTPARASGRASACPRSRSCSPAGAPSISPAPPTPSSSRTSTTRSPGASAPGTSISSPSSRCSSR